jgi:hypothetical protein
MKRIRGDWVQDTVGLVQCVDHRARQRAPRSSGCILFQLFDRAGAQNYLSMADLSKVTSTAATPITS